MRLQLRRHGFGTPGSPLGAFVKLETKSKTCYVGGSPLRRIPVSPQSNNVKDQVDHAHMIESAKNALQVCKQSRAAQTCHLYARRAGRSQAEGVCSKPRAAVLGCVQRALWLATLLDIEFTCGRMFGCKLHQTEPNRCIIWVHLVFGGTVGLC